MPGGPGQDLKTATGKLNVCVYGGIETFGQFINVWKLVPLPEKPHNCQRRETMIVRLATFRGVAEIMSNLFD